MVSVSIAQVSEPVPSVTGATISLQQSLHVFSSYLLALTFALFMPAVLLHRSEQSVLISIKTILDMFTV